MGSEMCIRDRYYTYSSTCTRTRTNVVISTFVRIPTFWSTNLAGGQLGWMDYHHRSGRRDLARHMEYTTKARSTLTIHAYVEVSASYSHIVCRSCSCFYIWGPLRHEKEEEEGRAILFYSSVEHLLAAASFELYNSINRSLEK